MWSTRLKKGTVSVGGLLAAICAQDLASNPANTEKPLVSPAAKAKTRVFARRADWSIEVSVNYSSGCSVTYPDNNVGFRCLEYRVITER